MMDRGSKESQESLLAHDEEEFRNTGRPKTSRRWCTLMWLWPLGNVVFFFLFSSSIYISGLKNARCHESLASPVMPEDVLVYERRPEWVGMSYPWHLGPSEELDQAWDDLLYPLNIRVTKDEFLSLGANLTDRIQIMGGDDYIGVMGVYHYLHCLNNIRRIVHWDYYEGRVNWGRYNGPFRNTHIDHCIDAIRQSLMCHANTEIHTGVWNYDPTFEHATALGSHATQTCVNWERLDDWTRERTLIEGTYKLRPGRH